MLKSFKISIFAILSLNIMILCFSDLSAYSSSNTGRLAQRKAYRDSMSSSQTNQGDLADVDSSANRDKTPSSTNNTDKNLTQRSQDEGDVMRANFENRKNLFSNSNQNLYYYSSNYTQNRSDDNQYIAQAQYQYRIGGQRYGGEDANRYASPNDPSDYQPNYNPVPQGDWDTQQNWQYYRKEFYSGETQQDAYRQHHPYGAGGIGYYADPEYLKMEQMERGYNNRNNVPNRDNRR